MTVDKIIKQVRWCIDEESNSRLNITSGDEKDDLYMDNIIKAKIPDALRWIAVTAASSSMLSSSSDAQKTTTSSKSSSSTTTSTSMSVELFDGSTDIGVITMPDNISVFNINRVRTKGWHKAVIPVEDTDDAALEMFDESAKGTVDRPQAAIMRVKPLKILIQPITINEDDQTINNVTVSYVGVPLSTTGSGASESVDVPSNFQGAFIYYIAFLLLSAYDDSKANQMYSIALQQLGVNQTK